MIPAQHHGIAYTEVMKDLCAKRQPGTYLEVGVNTGNLLQHITAKLAICVDPEFVFDVNPMRGLKTAKLYQQTSDGFFASQDAEDFVGQIDLAFLDGMHLFEYLLRDFYNTERLCNSRSLVVMHDCLPLNAEMTHRDFAHSLEIGRNSSHPLYWTGDVWKIIPILKKFRPDLRILCVDAPPTGLVFVTNLDPGSTVLPTNYMSIVDEFRVVPSTVTTISELYGTVEIMSSAAITNQFDNTLFFKT